MASFQYKRRDPSSIEKQAEQRGGLTYEGIIKQKYRTFKTVKGNNWLRILPATWEGAKHYGYELYAHYNVGPEKANIICPVAMKRGKCPICEARLREERAGVDKETLRDFQFRKRYICWVLDRAKREDADVPQIWDMAYTLDRDIAVASKDRTTGTIYWIDDPYEGYDITFEKIGESLSTRYVSPQIARQPSSVSDAVLEYIAANPIPETLHWRDYDEINRIFQGLGTQEEQAPPPRREPPKQETRSAPADDDSPPWDRPHPDEEAPQRAAERRQPEERLSDAPRAEGRPAPRQAPPLEAKEEAVSGKSRAEQLRARLAERRAAGA